VSAPRTLPQRLPRGPAEQLSRPEREWRYEYSRRRYLPAQIDATRLKLRHLEAEAARYGLHELVQP
jgi:hypothetical protein